MESVLKNNLLCYMGTTIYNIPLLLLYYVYEHENTFFANLFVALRYTCKVL